MQDKHMTDHKSPTPDVKVAFGRYRVLAVLTGIVLAFLTVVAIPYKYVFGGTGTWTAYAWMAHGWMYLIYFIVTLDLGLRARWSMTKLLLFELAGTVPFMSFISERKLRKELGL
jgi:integral membrane protein